MNVWIASEYKEATINNKKIWEMWLIIFLTILSEKER